LSILESSRHELRIAHGLTFMTLSPRGWEAFPTPRALTRTRITWAFSPLAPQVPGVTPGSPLCPWCFGLPFWRGAQQAKCCGDRLTMHYGISLLEHMFKYSMHVCVLRLSNETYIFSNLIQTNSGGLSKTFGIKTMQKPFT
jgi:hypothetical protein